MSERKHTPGPWTVEDPFVDYLSIVIGDQPYNWRFVAHVHTDLEKGGSVKVIGKAQMEANARLISAAPDMLEALEALLAHYIEIADSGDCGFWDPRKEPVVIAATAAISKATGGGE